MHLEKGSSHLQTCRVTRANSHKRRCSHTRAHAHTQRRRLSHASDVWPPWVYWHLTVTVAGHYYSLQSVRTVIDLQLRYVTSKDKRPQSFLHNVINIRDARSKSPSLVSFHLCYHPSLSVLLRHSFVIPRLQHQFKARMWLCLAALC